MMLGLNRRRRGISAKLAEPLKQQSSHVCGLTSPLPCLWEGNAYAAPTARLSAGEGKERECERKAQTPTTDKNSVVLKRDLKPCQNIWQHLEGSCSLKEVFINFVVRLGNDREEEEVEKGTGK